MLQGIDVSHWEGNIDWSQVAKHVKFAIIKCTEGTNYKDDKYTRNKQGCIDNGIPHGAYHFFHTNLDPVVQARYFYSNVGPNVKMLVCDVETNEGGDLKANLRTFMSTLDDLSGHRPWIYTGPAFWRAYGIHDEQWCAYHPLWIANYGVDKPNVPPGWSSWDIWQYSDKGDIPGIISHVDLDVLDGTETELSDIFANGTPQPPQVLPKNARVKATQLNIRTAPGDNSMIIGHIPYGFVAHITGSGLDSSGRLWYQSGANAYFASWWTDPVDA